MDWLFLPLVGGLLLALYLAYRRHGQRPSTVSRGDRALSSDAATPGLMHRANALKHAYALVLETTDRGLIRPESHLPASKEAIKAALLLCALSSVSTVHRRHDAATLHHFQVSYGFLAHFVGDETFGGRLQGGEQKSARDDSARQEVGRAVAEQASTDAAPPRRADSPSPVEFLTLCEEFAQRFDALTDRERGQAEGLRIRTALLNA